MNKYPYIHLITITITTNIKLDEIVEDKAHLTKQTNLIAGHCLNVNSALNNFLINPLKGHFTVIEPSKFQNKTMKSSNINALFCHTNTKMPENYNFLILVHCYPIIN